MSSADFLPALRRLAHFRGLPPDLLEAIARGSTLREFSSGQMVFLQGDAAKAFYVVRRGGVRVYRTSSDGREQVLHHLRAGQSFGEAAVLSFHRYPAHAAAVEDATELIEIGAQTFSQLFESDRRLAAAMVSSLCMWLHELAERVEELSVPSAAARLARYLLRQPARGASDPLAIELAMSKKELAAHLAIVPETLSRLLRKWQDERVVETDGRALSILDSRELARRAETTSAAGA